MAEDHNDSSFNHSFESRNSSVCGSSDCIPWLAVSITECLAIVIFNLLTIIVFVKQRQLQRRSTYLIIHLAVVDLLVGAVSGPVIIAYLFKFYLDSQKKHSVIFPIFSDLFPTTSIANLAVIALERRHATFYPFKYREVKKWIYGIIIVAIWFVPLCREIAQDVLYYREGNSDLSILFSRFSFVLYSSVFLSIICISYIAIFIKIRCSPNPHPHNLGPTKRERRLTTTLLFVTLASLLTWLPSTFFRIAIFWGHRMMSSQSFFYIYVTVAALIGASSLVNPIVYAVRMPEFREGLVKLFRKDPNHAYQADSPLRTRQSSLP